MNCTKLTRKQYEAWKDANYSGIGGSDAAQVMGMSKYGSPFKVWKEKLYGRESITNPNIEAGILFEDAIAQHFGKENKNYDVIREECIYQHSDYPFLIANIDRLLFDKESNKYHVLEIKNTREANANLWNNGSVPDDYFWQVMHYLMVLQVEKAYIHVCLGGFDFKTIEFLYEDYVEEINSLMEAETNFWNNNVLLRVSPPIDEKQSTAEAVDIIITKSKEAKERKLSKDENDLLEELKAAEDNCKHWSDEVSRIKSKLKYSLASLGKFVGSSFSVTIREQTSQRFLVEKFKTENPALYKQYLGESSFTVMTTRSIKKESK